MLPDIDRNLTHKVTYLKREAKYCWKGWPITKRNIQTLGTKFKSIKCKIVSVINDICVEKDQKQKITISWGNDENTRCEIKV